jgi:tripartite-type tricarboxylate transporter receptor subunit TctC
MKFKNILAAGVMALLATTQALADAYPSKPIEIVVPFPAGGVTDVVARAFAATAPKYFPGQFIVINKPGASGTIGMGEVMRAKPDGYKLVMLVPEVLIAPRLGIGNVRYQDLTLLARFTDEPATVTVRTDSPWKTLEEFMAYAKANPGKISVGTSAVASIYNVAIAAINDRANVKLTHIAYQGEAPAVMGLLSDQIEATTVSFTPTAQHIAAGKLRVLGVMADKRAKQYPNVPTLKERGINASFSVWRAIGGPKGLAPEVVSKLNDVFKKVAADPDFQTMLNKQSVDVVFQDGPTFASALAREDAELSGLLPKMDMGAK